jgi:hypothetical protein
VRADRDKRQTTTTSQGSNFWTSRLLADQQRPIRQTDQQRNQRQYPNQQGGPQPGGALPQPGFGTLPQTGFGQTGSVGGDQFGAGGGGGGGGCCTCSRGAPVSRCHFTNVNITFI